MFYNYRINLLDDNGVICRLRFTYDEWTKIIREMKNKLNLSISDFEKTGDHRTYLWHSGQVQNKFTGY